MSSISLNNAYLLFLIIPLAALLIVPFVIAVRKENVNGVVKSLYDLTVFIFIEQTFKHFSDFGIGVFTCFHLYAGTG